MRSILLCIYVFIDFEWWINICDGGCFSQVRSLARTDEARGLLWLMEEEAVQPGGSEETMLERLFSYYGSGQGENKGGCSSF